MRLCQLEYYSADVQASLQFIETVLGWKQVPIAIQDQVIIEVPETSLFGISIRKGPALASASPALLAYFEVEQTLSELRDLCFSLGAKILQEPTPVTGYGNIMIVEERGGLRFGLYGSKS